MSRSLSRPSSLRYKRGSWPITFLVIAALVIAAPLVFAAKGGNSDKSGGSGGGTSQKVPGPSSTVSGSVTNNYGVPVADAQITLTTLTATFATTSDGSGSYSIKVPANAYYDVVVEADHHTAYTAAGSLIKGKNNTLNIELQADAAVIVNASVSAGAAPGGTLSLSGSYIILDGSTFVESSWSQLPDEGVPAVISDPTSLNPTVTLGTTTEYKEHLLQVLREPPLTVGDLPPDLTLQPINEIHKGLQDRTQVVGINHLALEKGADVPLDLTVTTTSGEYSASVDVATKLPWHVNPGLRTVPIDAPALLQAKCGEDDESQCPSGTTFSWSINSLPPGSIAALEEADTRNPWFTPDKAGVYEFQETVSGETLTIHAGIWQGVIDPGLTASDWLGDGRPVPDQGCTGCHSDFSGIAPDKFTTWRLTGHAEIFTQNLNSGSGGHYSENCFGCHTVGFNPDASNFGFDDDYFYDAFLQSGLLNSTIYAWDDMLADPRFDGLVRLSNVQCESCHGPQNGTEAHGFDNSEYPAVDHRVSLSPDVCASCHGEPARHGRFQQWQLSNHADYDLARERGAGGFAPGNCGRCHSGNGFVAWNKLDFDPDQNVNVTWDEDTVVPQVCAACHDPHDTGTTSGDAATNATVRVNGEGGTCGGPDCDTFKLTAGFTATNVGKGATCMTCHNSRADEPRNDANWENLSDGQKTGGPHHGVQADLIMGQNMYFLAPGDLVPGDHKLIEDTCVTCHMNATLPPDLLSYNQSGTNHTFAADPGICVDCHGDAGEFLAQQVDTEITGYMDDLADELGAAFMRLMANHYPVAAGGGCNAADGNNPITAVTWNYGGHSGATLDITVDDGSQCTDRGLSSIQVDGGASSLEDALLDPANGAEDLLKARWNYGLNYEDATINGCEDNTDPNCDPPHTRRGVHNHSFSQKGLISAIQAVQAVAVSP